MAKQAKMSAATPSGVAADDLKRVVAEISRQKNLASEYAGNAGKATQNAVEKHGLDKTSLTFARRLSDMEAAKRDAVVQSSLDYWEKLGFLDGGMFSDDLIGRLEAIVNRAHNSKTGGAPKAAKSAEDTKVDDALLN